MHLALFKYVENLIVPLPLPTSCVFKQLVL
nr:MAG TPA: hypothetical protein [Caudoviricetes sp.]